MEHCNHCRRVVQEPVLCSACHLAVYCNDECAEHDWFLHAQEHDDDYENLMDLVVGSGRKGEASVYLGSVDALYDPNALDHIDAVVSALGENYDNASIRRLVGRERFHLRVTLWDEPNANIAQDFDRVADWIHEQVIWDRHVLVHCVAGHSRSTTFLLYYMLKYEGFASVDTALEHVQSRRPTAHPNRGFMKQLRKAAKNMQIVK